LIARNAVVKLHFLKYFSVLAEELHFGRAANRLAITQSPLSLAIKSLEDELGARLLVRNSKMVQLTPAGAAYLIEARQILERLDRAAALVKAVDSGMTGRLDIGMSPSLIYREVIQVVSEFNRETPAVDVVLHEMPLTEQQECLMRGQLHAGFANGSAIAPQLKSIALKADKYVLCLPEGHVNAEQAIVDLGDLAHERFVMFSREIAPANHDHVIAIFSRSGIHPRTVHMARTWFAVMAMVSQGCGVALVPSSMARARMAGVRLVPFAGAPVQVPARLLWNPALMAPVLAKFVDSAARTLKRKRP
jgi:DNA-binding transcriptional LysR family regulator